MTAVIPTPTRDAIFSKLGQIDVNAQRFAWDMPPTLAALMLTDEGTIESVLIDDDLPHPADRFLIDLGPMMNHDLKNTKDVLDKLPGTFVAMVFVSEGTISPAAANADQLRAFAAAKNPRTMPGAQMVRLVLCTDITGRVFQVSRIRNPGSSVPDIELLDDESAPRLRRHQLVIALQQCTRAMSVWLPDGGTALSCLDKLLTSGAPT